MDKKNLSNNIKKEISIDNIPESEFIIRPSQYFFKLISDYIIKHNILSKSNKNYIKLLIKQYLNKTKRDNIDIINGINHVLNKYNLPEWFVEHLNGIKVIYTIDK
jgi:hypothetical protein